ncbi:hypothetical protein PHYSODRAFT_526744, partial [Phytophthora sojae]
EVVLWAQDLLKELGVKQTIETTLFCDNQSTLKAIENNGNSERLRNYAKVIRYIAEYVDAGKAGYQAPSTYWNAFSRDGITSRLRC